jgi:signal transduction histidine kinase
MAQIIRQLLDFARAGEHHSVSCDARELATRTLALLSPVAAKRGIELVLLAEPVLPRVEVDPGQIQQVLANLVVNAVQATAARGKVELALGCETRAPSLGAVPREHLVIRVTDHGAGMSEEVLARVFEPFFTTKGVGEGTGLGLSVAHGIVEEHGGFIVAESREGSGSQFSVFLPIPERA